MPAMCTTDSSQLAPAAPVPFQQGISTAVATEIPPPVVSPDAGEGLPEIVSSLQQLDTVSAAESATAIQQETKLRPEDIPLFPPNSKVKYVEGALQELHGRALSVEALDIHGERCAIGQLWKHDNDPRIGIAAILVHQPTTDHAPKVEFLAISEEGKGLDKLSATAIEESSQVVETDENKRTFFKDRGATALVDAYMSKLEKRKNYTLKQTL